MSCYEQMEDLHFRGLQGMYFTGIQPIEFGTFLSSSEIEDTYYNYCARFKVHGNDFAENWAKVKTMFSANRTPALYVTPSSDLYGQERAFLASFERQYTDAWMVMQNGRYLSELATTDKITVQPITNQDDFKESFVETFQIAYSSDDPNDPYGQLSPTYKNSLLNSWGKNPEYKKCHYLAKYEGKPAGVITAVSYKGFVGIYNVGTIPQYRHLGVGKAMMSVVSKEVGRDDVLFLQTEKGSLVEKWYETMGFQTIFYGECYTEG